MLRLPKLGDAGVVFVEGLVAGYSHKTFMTRIGGSFKCLTVVVTGSDLSLTTSFPYTVFARDLDIEHLIPLGKILKVEERGSIVEVEFLNEAGLPAKFSLRLRKAGEFVSAMRAKAFVSP
ncbi:hypothetical protein [Luteolibacter soli]|uniref:Uncharacterized protein n=1 Tax=Luteolibacter soli TaxID=3135280 RepID=A0ABU9AVL3_9BACT